MIQRLLLIGALMALTLQGICGPTETFKLWPGVPPGDENLKLPPEIDKTKDTDKLIAGRRIIKLGNVSSPEIAVYPATGRNATGTSVIICPGGGHHILAYDLEGTEVAEWLNELGVTAFVLKYRVPFRDKDRRWIGAVQDAQRAVSVIRSRAEEFGVDRSRIGILGFSAGGETAALTSIFSDEQRQYAPVDADDRISCRPDFTVLVYSAGIIEKDGSLRSHVAKSIDKNTPPAFLVHAQNDRVSSDHSTQYFIALKKAGVSAELHIWPDGGHGYGLRRTELPITTWPDRCRDWMKASGLLEPWFVEDFGQRLATAYAANKPLPQFSPELPEATVTDAYAVQKRYIEKREKTEPIGGYKGAMVSEAAQKKNGLEHAVSGVLFKSGWMNPQNHVTLDIKKAKSPAVETELGIIIGKDIRQPIGSVEELLPYIEALVPVIELPGGPIENKAPRKPTDTITTNIGSNNYIVGPKTPPASVDPDTIKITLKRDGEVLHETTGGTAAGGQWSNFLHQVNHALQQGYSIKKGHIIITGALGKIAKGRPGRHTASFSTLGNIEFTLK